MFNEMKFAKQSRCLYKANLINKFIYCLCFFICTPFCHSLSFLSMILFNVLLFMSLLFASPASHFATMGQCYNTYSISLEEDLTDRCIERSSLGPNPPSSSTIVSLNSSPLSPHVSQHSPVFCHPQHCLCNSFHFNLPFVMHWTLRTFTCQ